MPYIEIKTREKIGLTVVRQIVARGSTSGILTTGKITNRAKQFLTENDVAYAENIPEEDLIKP
ncbi:MAG: hypothetical protein IGS48_11285 [Oscillatoriales cyanobacterium C42_A2020_001]|nr:hypothetical protein [Leptolyngbyaceae cyanobacterium C42_A2020_001]